MRSVSPTDLSQKAFVRGLSDEVDEESLRRFFSKFGNIVDVSIARSRETKAPRGFGFVTFSNSTDCSKAISDAHGKEFHGRVLQVELASHINKGPMMPRGGGSFRSSMRGGYRGRGGRASSVSPPPRDGGYRRGGSSFRGGAFRASSGRGEYRSYRGRDTDVVYAEDRFRGGFDRDPPPREFASRYESSYEYRGRPERFERDLPEARDFPSYRTREYAGGDRDYGSQRSREVGGGSGYYSPPRDYVPVGRDYPPTARDYPPARAERDFDYPSRRYASRDYMDDYPSPGNGGYEGRPARKEFEVPARDYGASGRYESYTTSSGRGSTFKSSSGGGRGTFSSGGGRGSFSGRGGARDDYAPRGMPARRMSSRDNDRSPMMMQQRPRQIRSPDGGPPPKRMKPAGDTPMRRSPRGAPSSGGRRY